MTTARLRHALSLVPLLAACAAIRASAADDELRQVVVHNPTGAAVLLHPVTRDGFGLARLVGAATRIALRLAPGRYALSVGDEPPRFALPMPPRELGHEPPDALLVAVRPKPPRAPGFAWIPAGPTIRGDDLGVGQEDERPLSTPHVEAFWLATHETTNAQYVTFLNAVGRAAVDPAWLDLDGHKCRVQWDDEKQAFTTDAPELPAVTVSWPGAVAYCDWRTETTGVRHRLPTETEWEKAARGPGSRVYAYGDTCRTDAANQESGRLREVGQYAPNGFDLHDMTANAFEWCQDAYASGAYAGEVTQDTTDASRVLRGGSFVLDGIFCRNSMRMRLRPDVRADDVGFRVLREADGGR